MASGDQVFSTWAVVVSRGKNWARSWGIPAVQAGATSLPRAVPAGLNPQAQRSSPVGTRGGGCIEPTQPPPRALDQTSRSRWGTGRWPWRSGRLRIHGAGFKPGAFRNGSRRLKGWPPASLAFGRAEGKELSRRPAAPPPSYPPARRHGHGALTRYQVARAPKLWKSLGLGRYGDSRAPALSQCFIKRLAMHLPGVDASVPRKSRRLLKARAEVRRSQPGWINLHFTSGTAVILSPLQVAIKQGLAPPDRRQCQTSAA